MDDSLGFVRTGARNREEAVTLCGEQFTVPDSVGMSGDPECFAVIESLWCIGPMTLAKVGSGDDGWVSCGERRATYDVKLPQGGQLRGRA